MGKTDEPGRLKRTGHAIGRYGLRRIRPPELGKGNRKVIAQGWRGALTALRPVPADKDDLRGGYAGRHTDGGRARFAELVQSRDLDDGALDRIAAGHRNASLFFGAAALLVLVFGLYSIVGASSAIMMISGIAVALFGGVFAALAIRADFARWQIISRRFGGFREYLDRRA